jgi:hypothetical protein
MLQSWEYRSLVSSHSIGVSYSFRVVIDAATPKPIMRSRENNDQREHLKGIIFIISEIGTAWIGFRDVE